MGSVEQGRRGRINLRVDPNQEARLRAAAEANGETLTGFLLTAGAERAEAVLERVRNITVSAAAFKRFMTALNEDATPDPMPALTRYAKESSPIPFR